MKCRNIIKNSSGSYDIVWFGKVSNSPAEKIDNYVTNQEAVAKSLTQRLSVIKTELWYDINHGLPLFDKIRNKAIFDAAIINIINGHDAVKSIISYTSKVDQITHQYEYTCVIDTIYNKSITLSSYYQI